jgi:hypothetical protein
MNETTGVLTAQRADIQWWPWPLKNGLDWNGQFQWISDGIIWAIIIFAVVALSLAISMYCKRGNLVRRYQAAWGNADDADRLDIPLDGIRALKQHSVEIAGKWRRCVDASDVLNEKIFGEDLDQNRILTTMPALLTGLGILGTFLGLQYGLSSLAATNSQNISDNIWELIKGCAVAFITSIWGISTSIALGLIEKFLDGQSKKQLHSLHSLIDKDLPRYAPEDALRDVADNTKAAKTTLDGLATQIGDKIQQGITQAITESLDNSLKNLTEKLAKSLHEGMQQGQGSILQGMLTEMSEGLKQQLSTLTTEVATVGGRLSEPLVQATKQISGTMEQFAETTNRVGQVVEGTTAQMDQGLQVIQAQSNIAERLSETADRFAVASQSLDPFRESLIVAANRNLEAAESQKMASAAQQGFLQSVTSATDKLGDLRATYESAALALRGIAEPIQRLTGLVDRLIANSTAGQEANEAAWNKATAALASSGEYVEAISAASKDILIAAQRFETLKMTLSTAGAQAATATGHIQKATEANERIAASLTVMSGQLPSIVKVVDKTRIETDKAQQDVGGLRELINGLNTMLTTMGQERDQEEAERLARLTELINDAAERMKQAAQAFAAVDSLGKVLQASVTAFMGATANLQIYGTDVKQSAAAHRESAKHSLDAVQEYRELMELLAGLPDSIAEASGTLQNAGDVLKEGSTATNNTMREVLVGQQRWLQGTKVGLTAMQERLQEIINAYGVQVDGQTNALMKQWSVEVSGAVQSYGERVEEIRELVENLKEQLEQQNEE